MTKAVWKSLEELAGDSGVETRRTSEFDDAVTTRLAAIRREYGIGAEDTSTPHAGQTAARERSARAADLQALLPPLSRRGFMRLTGAAAVFGLTGCWHESPEVLVPYRQQPAGSTIGVARYYSTFIRHQAQVWSAMGRSYDGRPIKLEGNPDCPLAGGGLGLAAQAALLDLYDADRCKDGPKLRAEDGALVDASWAEADKAAGASMSSGVVALVTPHWNGPSRLRLLADLQAGFGQRLRQVAYDPTAAELPRQARQRAYGAASTPVHHPAEADLILCLGSDLLGGGQADAATIAGYGRQRRLRGQGAAVTMGQLVAVEATMSQTGTCADLRVRLAPEEIEAFAWTLGLRLAEALGQAVPEALRARARFDTAALDPHPALDTDQLSYLTERLLAIHAAGHHSLIYVGGASQEDPKSLGLHLAGCWLNSLLGNEGQTVSAGVSDEIAGSRRAFSALLDDCAAGQVQTLVLAGVNPAFSWPDQAQLTAALHGVAQVVVLADRLDETAAQAQVFLPLAHDLESWGDAEPRPGVFALQQPLINRLWDSRGLEESLMALAKAAKVAPKSLTQAANRDRSLRSAAGQAPLWLPEQVGVRSWADYLRATWEERIASASGAITSGEDFWIGALNRGVVGQERIAPAQPFQATALSGLPALPGAPTGMQLVISASRTLGDGSQANNAFLQEVPDPVSKVCWDGYAALSLADAEALELGPDAVIDLELNGQRHRLPALVQPGQKAGVVEVFTGWGRHAAGEVARVGGVDEQAVNAFGLSPDGARWGIPVTVTRAEARYRLANTQGHQYLDGRDIASDDVLALHRQDPAVAQRGHHHALWENGTTPDDPNTDPHLLSLWGSTYVNVGRRWGMAIDLNACTGCNACVVACSVENNVPVVGRDEVRLGREMHWIRIDRYYTTYLNDDERHHGTLASEKLEGRGAVSHYAAADDRFLEVIHQPMLCQQCGHAPCEEVCPAMATMHNDEGQNVQVYNRCIGTRYCANNCPYKVRRFNFYEYSKYRFGPQGSGDPLLRVTRNLVSELNTSGSHELMEAPLQMMLNPEVTVRSKGVMEKCNFCIARTRKVREHEKRSGRKAPESMMQTACSATCPTSAITFGDINDPDSTVSQAIAAREHGYKVLDTLLNTRPSITYQRRIRHRPALPDEQAAFDAGQHHPAEAPGHAAHGEEAHA